MDTVGSSYAPLVAVAAAAFFMGASVVYFTPLKYSQLIEPKIKDVAAQEIYEAMQANPDKYDFIDVRPTGMFDELHAAGSRNIPLHLMYFERVNLPKSEKTIVLICSGAVASGVAYMYLEHFGFRNVVRVEGGIEAWQMAELPVLTKSIN